LKFFPLRRSGSAFVQSGFYEVAHSPALRAMLCHATSQNPPDSKDHSIRFDCCVPVVRSDAATSGSPADSDAMSMYRWAIIL
jgi:hypothetical protein